MRSHADLLEQSGIDVIEYHHASLGQYISIKLFMTSYHADGLEQKTNRQSNYVIQQHLLLGVLWNNNDLLKL